MAPRPDDSDEPARGPEGGVPGPGAERPDPGADSSAPVDDAAWAAIVAQLNDVDSADAPTRTDEAPDTTGLDFPVAPWVTTPHVVRAADEPPAAGRDWDGTSQYDDAEATVDEAEAFQPPDPGPVLGGDPLLTMAWLAAAGMPIFLLVVLIAWSGAPAALVQAACVVFVLGVGVLVWRMPSHRDPGDDDTGAVV